MPVPRSAPCTQSRRLTPRNHYRWGHVVLLYPTSQDDTRISPSGEAPHWGPQRKVASAVWLGALALAAATSLACGSSALQPERPRSTSPALAESSAAGASASPLESTSDEGRSAAKALPGTVKQPTSPGVPEPPAAQPQAQLRLLTDQPQLRPGGKLLLIAELQIDAGAHIPWQQEATQQPGLVARFTVPPGFVAGAAHYSAPSRLRPTRGFVGIDGQKDECGRPGDGEGAFSASPNRRMLPDRCSSLLISRDKQPVCRSSSLGHESRAWVASEVQVPRHLEHHVEYAFEAHASWQVCSSVCSDAKNFAQLLISTRASVTTTPGDDIATALGRLPRPISELSGISQEFACVDGLCRFVLRSTDAELRDFFARAGPWPANEQPTIAADASQLTLQWAHTTEALRTTQHPTTTIRGVLEVLHQGQARFFELDLPAP